MYDFDMQALLSAFNNDPSKLADAFTKQLNEALIIQRREQELKENANHLTESWNNFIKQYFEIRGIEQDIKNYIFANGEELENFIQLLLEVIPEAEKYLKAFENINLQTEKVKDFFADNIAPTADEFKKVMKDFFNKYDL